MNIVSFDKEKVTLEFTSQEFGDLWSAMTTVYQEYDRMDHSMLRVPEDRIEHLAEALGTVLDAQGARYTIDQPPQR